MQLNTLQLWVGLGDEGEKAFLRVVCEADQLHRREAGSLKAAQYRQSLRGGKHGRPPYIMIGRTGNDVVVTGPVAERQVDEVREWDREDGVVGIWVCDCETSQALQLNPKGCVAAEHAASFPVKSRKSGGNVEAFESWHAEEQRWQAFRDPTVGVGGERSSESELLQVCQSTMGISRSGAVLMGNTSERVIEFNPMTRDDKQAFSKHKPVGVCIAHLVDGDRV